MLEDKSQKKYPIIVYNHGMGYGDFENPTLWNELVKKGYVVVVLTHKYISDMYRDEKAQITNLPDSKFWYVQDGPILFDELTRTVVKDSLLALVDLRKTNETEFEGKIDLEKYFAMGWSLGGAVASYLLNSDTRCIGAINMDGNLLAREKSFTYTKPQLTLLSEFEPDIKPRMATVGFDKLNKKWNNFIVIKKAMHMVFAERHVVNYGPNYKMLKIVREISIGFIDRIFKGEEYQSYIDNLKTDKRVLVNTTGEDYTNKIVLAVIAILGIGMAFVRTKK